MNKKINNHLWQGKWIWLSGDGKTKNSYYHFRKEFEVTDKNNIKLYITADTRYQLFINGEYISYGPVQSQPYYKYYDLYDIDSYLQIGKNSIAIIVYYEGHMEFTRGGLLAEIMDSNKKIITCTDESWKVTRAKAWQEDTYYTHINRYAPYQDFYNASLIPEGWDKCGYNDSMWEQASVIKGFQSSTPPAVHPWGYLKERDIPFMKEEYILPSDILSVEESLGVANRFRSNDLSIKLSAHGKKIKYSTVKSCESLLTGIGNTIIKCGEDLEYDGVYNPSMIFDFGKVVTAFLEIDVEGEEGAVIDIGYVERLIDDRFNNAIECTFADRYVLKKGRQKYRFFNWRGFRFAKLLFSNCSNPLIIYSVRAITTNYPFKDRGSFKSSDPMLNSIFDICQYTIKLCCNEFMMDTPWREQSQWVGDVSAVTIGGVYSCFGDISLPEKYIAQCAMNQLPTGLLPSMTNIVATQYFSSIPDYSLWWVIALWQHYEYSGNEACIHDNYGVVLKIMDFFYRYIDEYGMLSNVPYWVFIDWSDIDKSGRSTALNSIFYGAMEAMVNIASFKGDLYTVKKYDDAMNTMKINFVDTFYDESKGCFVDSNSNGHLSSKVSEASSMSAIYFKLCDRELSLEIVDRFYESKTIRYTETEPFFTSVIIKAMDSLGKLDLAVELIKDRWGNRMVKRGATSCYEEWGINGSNRTGNYQGFLRSQSHAWSAAPAEFMLKNLIGLEIVEPGGDKIRVNPKAVNFDYEVTFPLIKGYVRVSQNNGAINIEVSEGIELV